MTIEIPVWLLWAVGIVVGIPLIAFILFMAWIGWQFVKSYSGNSWWY